MAENFPPNREQLQKVFGPNHERIKQFEQLFRSTKELIDAGGADAVAATAQLAEIRSAEVLALLQDLVDSLGKDGPTADFTPILARIEALESLPPAEPLRTFGRNLVGMEEWSGSYFYKGNGIEAPVQSGVFENGSGDVGIGTITPGQKLEVNGSIRITSSGNTLDFGDQNRVFGFTAGGVIYMAGAGDAAVCIDSNNNGTASHFTVRRDSNNPAAGTELFRVSEAGNVYPSLTPSTTMTNGFFYIPAASGPPTGVPTSVSGHVPMYYDSAANEFYIYNGSWVKVALA